MFLGIGSGPLIASAANAVYTASSTDCYKSIRIWDNDWTTAHQTYGFGEANNPGCYKVLWRWRYSFFGTMYSIDASTIRVQGGYTTITWDGTTATGSLRRPTGRRQAHKCGLS